MRAVVMTEPGVLELNYMWLPTFIGMNTNLKTEIEKSLAPQLEGMPLDEATLDWAHEQVVTFLEKRFAHVAGLRDFVDSLKFITGT
jgi:hypothetical protein